MTAKLSSGAEETASRRDAPESQVATKPGLSGLPMALVVPMFVASGATALIAQLCFSKYLGYVVGATAHAVSAVLAAFMAGLSLGAYLAGRFAHRVRRPLAAYGAMELVVALWVALSPLMFQALTPVYASAARSLPNSVAALAALRWASAMLIVVVPTTAMGATLPLLSRAFSGSSDVEAGTRHQKQLGALYAVNTLGGAVGAILAAYAILPALGIAKTLLAAALLSAVVGVAALRAARHYPLATAQSQEVHDGERDAHSARDYRWLVGLALFSGALVFSAEVVFTHLLALLIGNSVYAFGVILATFLACLFFGASQAHAAQRRFGAAALPLSLLATCAALAATLPVWDRLPLLFAGTGELIQSFAGRELMRGLAAFASLAVPVTLMGLTFPLLLQRVATHPNVAWLVGRLTAINTVGAVLGSLATGYFLLPVLGSEGALRAIGLCFLAMGLLLARASRQLSRGLWLVAGGAALLLVLVPRWDLSRLTAGTNVYFEGSATSEKLLMVREDVHGGVTTVTEANGVRTLYTNGKFQGNTGWEMSAQRYFAHYPSLFVREYDKVLVIGLGTGTTLSTLAAYPWRSIDVVEISPSIAAAARAYFGTVNLNALDDPRVALHFADGRNHLIVDDNQYDLISIELSSIWFAGASSLYSDEFYALVAEHLVEGGIFQQWVQLHHIFQRDFATVLHTLRNHFGQVALFYGGGQGIIVASNAPLLARLGRAQAQTRSPRFEPVLPREWQDLSHRARILPELMDDILVVNKGLDAFIAEIAQEAGEPVDDLVSTDDNLYLEYRTPRGNVLPWSTRDDLVARLLRFRDDRAIAAMRLPHR